MAFENLSSSLHEEKISNNKTDAQDDINRKIIIVINIFFYSDQRDYFFDHHKLL